MVDGHRVAVGKASWASAQPGSPWVRNVRRRAALDGALTIFVEVDDAPVGALLLDDPIRPDAARTIRQLRRDGIRRIVMVTGDREDNAQSVGAVIGVDEVLAERTPAEKVDAVRLEAPPATRSWSATASTMRPRSPSPTSASRSGPAVRPRRQKRPTSSSLSIASTGSAKPSSSRAAAGVSRTRA